VIVLIRRPRVFGYRALEIQPLSGLHVVQMLAHRPVRVPLDHEIYISLLILIARRRVWSYNRLLHLGPLVLRQQRRGDLQPGHIVGIRQCEAELFRVVVYLLHRVEFQVYETLGAACKCGGLGRGRAG